MIIVSVTHPGTDAATFRLEAPLIRIGREADNDIVLESSSCSRYHAEIRCTAGVYSILDCGSTNGIKIDGLKVTEAVLDNGSAATLGEYEFTFSIPPQVSAPTVLLNVSELGITAPAPKAPEVLYLHFGARDKERSVKIASGVEYMLGRSPGSDVVIDDTLCSGRHALIFSRDVGFFIRDLESANGTFLNAQKIGETRFASGDLILLGDTEISVSEQPRDVIDEDILLARTQLGLPVMRDLGHDADPELARRGSGAVSGGPARRWLFASLAVVGLAVVISFLVFKFLGATREPEGKITEGSKKEETIDGVLVRVRPVTRKDLAFSVSGAGSVQPHRRVTLSAEVAGRVLAIPVVEGMSVQPGELLVRLDDREVRLAIEEARSSISREQVDLARGEKERSQRLFDDGALTRSALNQAKTHYLSLDSAYRTAQARIAQLRERAEKARVTAPIGGTVARVLVNAGELAGPGTPLLVLEDASQVLVVVEVSDREVVKLRPLQVVEATSDAFPDRIFQGVVDKVASTANPVSKGFEVEARVGNSDGSLRSGMITSIRVLHEKRSSLVVPAEALMAETDRRAQVFVVKEGMAHSVTILLGGRLDRDVEVTDGLQEGDEVIVFGQEQVEDGQAVQAYERR